MAVYLAPIAGVAAQFFDNNGRPLALGKLYTYQAGTQVNAATYTSNTGVTEHTNPIVLDSGGRIPNGGEVWMSDNISYKFVLKDKNDVLIATWDNIDGINSNFITYSLQQEIQTATDGQTVFNLSTITYQPATGTLSVYVDGLNQYGPSATYSYVETDNNTGNAVDASVVTFTGFKAQLGNVQNLADDDGADWIGFQPDGTGAIAVSVQDKLREIVSVLDFGADSTGATSSDIAFTDAIATGKPVYVPYGTYKITSAITLPASTYLYGDNSIINVAYDGIGFTVADGRSNGTSATVTSAHTNDATDATTLTTAVVSSTSGYAVGDFTVLVGTNGQSFYSYIVSIVGTTITFDDYCTYTLTTPTLYKVTPSNVKIAGLNIYSGVSTPSTSSYLINADGSYVEVSNCTFGNSTYTASRCISGIGAYNKIQNNIFDKIDLAIQIYDAAHWSVNNNTITNFDSAIRLVRCDSCLITNNSVENGTNMPYGLGIELTAESTSYDKNCRNLVQGNTVIRANKGVPSSGIGGIHLNFSGSFNRIIGNTSRHNSFGIYLENNNSYNTIDGNICCDNDGYYGVGIELDWDNKYNVISNNVCNNNRGSTTAAESTGIQIRDYTTHPNLYNTIDGNSCEGNGLEGIRCGGNYTTVTGNTLFNNAVDIAAMNAASSLNKGWGIRSVGDGHIISGNIIRQNSYDSRSTGSFCQIGLSVEGGSDITITNNYIYGGYYAANGLSILNADNVNVSNNTIIGETNAGQAFIASGGTDVYVNTNFISQNNNATYAVQITTVNRYSLWGNIFTGALSTILLTGSTNRYTLGNN